MNLREIQIKIRKVKLSPPILRIMVVVCSSEDSKETENSMVSLLQSQLKFLLTRFKEMNSNEKKEKIQFKSVSHSSTHSTYHFLYELL
jgi:hypothetical protein